MWVCEHVRMWRCEHVKMYSRPPLLEEPFAQTSREKLLATKSWDAPKRWECSARVWVVSLAWTCRKSLVMSFADVEVADANVSEHMIWLSQFSYRDQHRAIRANPENIPHVFILQVCDKGVFWRLACFIVAMDVEEMARQSQSARLLPDCWTLYIL